MKINYHNKFVKSYKKRILPHVSIDKKFKTRLELFLSDSQNPLLKDHQLKGKKSNYRAFSVAGDIRVVYQKILDEILLYDIGSHNQVY